MKIKLEHTLKIEITAEQVTTIVEGWAKAGGYKQVHSSSTRLEFKRSSTKRFVNLLPDIKQLPAIITIEKAGDPPGHINCMMEVGDLFVVFLPGDRNKIANEFDDLLAAIGGQIVDSPQTGSDNTTPGLQSTACKECGAETTAGAKFCGACGATLSTQSTRKACAGCGMALEEGAKFCSGCGRKANGSAGISD